MNEDRSDGLLVTRLTVVLVMGTILACMTVAVASGILALRSTAKAELLQQTSEQAQEAAERERDRARFEADDLRTQQRCEAAQRAAEDAVMLDVLDAMSGVIEAELRGLSAAALVEQLATARAELVAAKAARAQQVADCVN